MRFWKGNQSPARAIIIVVIKTMEIILTPISSKIIFKIITNLMPI